MIWSSPFFVYIKFKTLLNEKNLSSDFYKLRIFYLIEALNNQKGTAFKKDINIEEVEKTKLTNIDLNISLLAGNQVAINSNVILDSLVKKNVVSFLQKNKQASIIKIEADRDVSLQFYISIENEINSAFNYVRNKESQKLFNKNYNSLDLFQKIEVEMIYPKNIKSI